MKMIFAVIRDKDSYAAIGALSEKNIGVTKLASSGGFLREGNTTLMIGVEDSRVEEVMGILRENCAKRTQIDVADRKSTRLNSSHITRSRMPSSA